MQLRKAARPIRLLVLALAAFLPIPVESATATNTPAKAAELPPPVTPREFFNAGTQKLREGKLLDAETLLENTLTRQIQRLQPLALYNLGHVRFGQGVAELEKGPAAGASAARARAAAQQDAEASGSADEALASDDVQKMVAAYLRGRGARRESKAATQAVRRALETHGTALNKWQRASGDFRSTVELKASDGDARHNAEVMDQYIAKLVDSLRELQQAAQALAGQNGELGEKMKQLKGRIPGSQMPPGAAGDDDEEEDNPFGPKPGDKEGPSKEGQEMTLSPEQAGWLLDGFKLDGERRLPMGAEGTADKRKRSGPTW